MPNNLNTRKIKRYGWVRDLPDHRDMMYSAPIRNLQELPASIDLRDRFPDPYDQGDLGSCTANAIAGAVQFVRRAQRKTDDFIPSRLFIYYNERVIEHTVNEDSGAQLRDGVKSVAKLGVCPESEDGKPYNWPYDIQKFNQKPAEPCYVFACDQQIISYLRVAQSLTQMRACLASQYPFVFGFSVYESFESKDMAATGVMSLPKADEALLGGHAVLAVGYNDATQQFIVRNSWGPGWGQKGYFMMPYAYATDPHLASDFWTIRRAE